jgi:hypothetical protein
MELDKSICVLDEIVYPCSLKEIVNKFYYKKEDFEFKLFMDNSFCRVIVLFDIDKKRLDETTEEMNNLIWECIKAPRVMHLNGEEFLQTIQNIKEKVNAGIPEKLFNDWFMLLAIQTSQLKHPLDELGKIKENYKPSGIVLEIEYNETGFANYLFFSSENNLLLEPIRSEIVKRVDNRIKSLFDKEVNKSLIPRKRDPIESRLRHEVFKRDRYKCKECGKPKIETTLHCDHIIPVSQGGTDELDNLQTLCQACNLAKSNRKWESKA